ncbi:hypothetical protein [Streptomyces yaizuensis]|uniref:Chitin-binding type-2 domain-containing protein n=1 Tax=Streptomyces yaizuensis TaxID=2989713 RepID=A0ABQ5P956_9ACTN|nr:hypothetical protein [Streptomyces sp. YSPA8]GLF99129.1 hypothetical protein SYYSPA8_32550 [Streptomyces sp. YSPA8]
MARRPYAKLAAAAAVTLLLGGATAPVAYAAPAVVPTVSVAAPVSPCAREGDVIADDENPHIYYVCDQFLYPNLYTCPLDWYFYPGPNVCLPIPPGGERLPA